MSANNKINDRSLKILKNLVERYIQDGQPVGSKTLAQDTTVMLSSASIRNIMADLESAGYLTSPHTSAGRIPTAQGYRLFIDNFLTIQPPAEEDVALLAKQLQKDNNAQSLVTKASNLLSSITRLTGVVTLPKREKLVLKLVEFLPLSQKRILVILVINGQEVQNRVIHADREYTTSECEQAGNYLTHHFAGKDLLEVRELLLEELRQEGNTLQKMLDAVMEMAEQVYVQETKNDYVLAGEANLFDAVDESHFTKLKPLFEAFSQKRDILHLLDKSLNAQGLQIFIGEESGYQVFNEYSMITAPYTNQDKVIGVLGIIGPKRMRYNKVVAVVDMTAKLLSQALEIKLL